MTILKHPIFYSTLLLAVAIYVAQHLNVPLPNWMTFYINDFLCMPIVLSFCLVFIRAIKKTETLYVPLYAVIILTTYYTVFFEWLMPQISNRYTFDIIDIGLYFIGAFLFYRFQKKLF